MSKGGLLTKRETERAIEQMNREEVESIRQLRKKVNPDDFDIIKVIGRGAFGMVFISFALLLSCYFFYPFSCVITGLLGEEEGRWSDLCHEEDEKETNVESQQDRTRSSRERCACGG